jgi:hypothetical protein
MKNKEVRELVRKKILESFDKRIQEKRLAESSDEIKVMSEAELINFVKTQLKESIDKQIMKEFDASKNTNSVPPSFNLPDDNGGSNDIVNFSFYKMFESSGGNVVITEKGQFSYSQIMKMSRDEALDYFNEYSMVGVWFDFYRNHMYQPSSPEALIKTLSSLPFSGVPDQRMTKIFAPYFESIKSDFSEYNIVWGTELGSLGSILFLSCEDQSLISPDGIDALAKHVAKG